METRQKRVAAILLELRALNDLSKKENRDFTGDETTKWDSLNAEKTKLEGEITALREAEQARSERQKTLDEYARAQDQPANDPVQPARIGAEDRAGSPKIEVTRNPELWARSDGEFFQAVMHAANGQSGSALVRDLAIHQQESRAATGLGTDIPHDGGYLVPARLLAGIRKDLFDSGQLLSRVFKMPSGKGSLTLHAVDSDSRVAGARMGGVQAYWVKEADALTASKTKFRELTMRSNKLGVLMYITEELKQDGVALASFMRQAATQELQFAAEAAIFAGTGAGQPLGLTNGGAIITIAKENGQAADTIKTENLQNMWARLLAPSRRKAVWFINQDCITQLQRLEMVVGTGGVPVYMPPGGLTATPYSTIFGRPVIELEHCATVGSLNDILLVDLSQYLWMETGGIKSASSIHVRFLNDEDTFRWTWRVDGQAFRIAPLTPLNGTNTLSPFVRLAARD